MVEETDRPTGLEQFAEIPAQLPPILMRMIGYRHNARFVAVYYAGTCATWTDGLALATFSYFDVYEPLISHPVIAAHLFDACLGHDDAEPTHALLCDRAGRRFYVGGFREVMLFLRRQHPGEITEEYLAGYRGDQVAYAEPRSIAEGRSSGMFEIFSAASEAARRETRQLCEWLDGQITEDLARKLIAALQGGDPRAIEPLRYIKEYCRAVVTGRNPEGVEMSPEDEGAEQAEAELTEFVS